MKITGSTKVTEAMKMSKKVAEVLDRRGLGCVGCRGAAQDSIEQVAVNNGLDIVTLLEELNRATGS